MELAALTGLNKKEEIVVLDDEAILPGHACPEG
jgi:hypothetical protein